MDRLLSRRDIQNILANKDKLLLKTGPAAPLPIATKEQQDRAYAEIMKFHELNVALIQKSPLSDLQKEAALVLEMQVLEERIRKILL